MLQIHAQTNRRITPERLKLAEAVFKAAGFDQDKYQMPEVIDLSEKWIMDHLEELQMVLPKYVLGNVAEGLQTNNKRRYLMGFLRRLALFLDGNVLTKRIQFLANSIL